MKVATSYKLKPTTGKLDANLHRYSAAQIDMIKRKLGKQLYYFGYVNDPDPAADKNPTAVFNFESHAPEHAEAYFGFRRDNRANLRQMVQDGGSKQGRTYDNNSGHDDIFEFYASEDLVKTQGPSRTWANWKLGYIKDTQTLTM